MLTMAEPKRKKPGPKKGARPPREIIITFKGYPEFDQWTRRLAAHLRLPVSVMIEHALIAFAQDKGFEEDAPER